jgi:RimJ/RimL family protein N-acetyltransferase
MIDFGHGIGLLLLNKDKDANDAIECRNDYRIWKWCRQNDLLSLDNHYSWFDKIKNDPTIKMYKITPSGDPNDVGEWLLGVCGLTDIDRVNQRAEFSLYIDPEMQRQGYAKAALKTLLSHGFMNQNLNVIWGETFEGNPAYDMFLKLGMKHEGTRRQFYFKEGRHIDAHLISMTRQEYMEAPWRQSQV